MSSMIGIGVEEESSRPEVAILFMVVSLILGLISRQALKGTSVPYTVALLLLGIGLGVLEYGTSQGLGVLGESIRLWANIDPNLILFVFLPALLFESSFGMEVHQIKRCLIQMVLLAGPGVMISTVSLGLSNLFFFPYGWNWTTSFLLGGLLSATDPVAVVALLKELGVSKKLNTIIEGESLINDGVAIVVFRLFLSMVLGQEFNALQTVEFLAKVALGAVALGLCFGAVSVVWVGTSFNDTIIEITLTFTASYMAFFIAEDQAGVSGVLTVMTVGIVFAAFGRTAFTGESERSMHHFWEMIAYIANTLIFILSGTVIAESILRSYDNIEGLDWGYLALLYLFVQLSRFLVVTLLYPALRYYGYGLDWKEATVLTWSGLRGAVALSLALSVAQLGGTDSLNHLFISKKTEALFVFFTGGVVFLTLTLNGSTAQYLIKLLELTRPSEAKARILEFVENEMYSKAVNAFAELAEDEELGPANWTVVKSYLSCIRANSDESKPSHPHTSHSGETSLHNMLLQDTRIRFLNGLQAAYWAMLEEGRITQGAAIILMQSVDEAVDEVAHSNSSIDDWKGLAAHVVFPRHYKYVQRRNTHLAWLPRRITTYLLVERLELACYISAAFLRGHRLARHQLHQFIGESSYAVVVSKESEAEEGAAQTFLEDVRITFPEVLRAIKDKQITRATLEHLSSYVQNLQQCGLLDVKESDHLNEAVQMSLKKLFRNPPFVKVPTGAEVLSTQPLIGALPVEVQEPLVKSAQEYVRLRRTLIFEQGTKPDGIWLIANGVVKWTEEKGPESCLVHQTFTHGSALGLYEALTGRHRLCRIVTETAVHCFFIEREKLLDAVKWDPELENFLWLESAVLVAKIVLRRQFGEATNQELRALFSSAGRLQSFISGEVISLNPGELGILLEGFIKGEGHEDDVISAPSGIEAESGDTQKTYFLAETRARVLLFRQQTSVSLKQTKPRRPSWHENNSARPSEDVVKGEMLPKRKSSQYLARAMEVALFGSQEKGLERSDIGSEDVSQTYFRRRSSTEIVRKMISHNSSEVLKDLVSGASSTQLRSVSVEITACEDDLRAPLLTSNERNLSDDSDNEDDIVQIGSPSALFGWH